MAGQVKPIPVPVILAAVNGDEDALAAVVAHSEVHPGSCHQAAEGRIREYIPVCR